MQSTNAGQSLLIYMQKKMQTHIYFSFTWSHQKESKGATLLDDDCLSKCMVTMELLCRDDAVKTPCEYHRQTNHAIFLHKKRNFKQNSNKMCNYLHVNKNRHRTDYKKTTDSLVAYSLCRQHSFITYVYSPDIADIGE
jgi:hypothetical protein